MLISLIVDNFMSFDKVTELNLISSNKIRQKSEHRVDVKNTSILKYSVIYGANAAGKSNLVKAFDFIQQSVLNALPAEASSMFCKSQEGNAKRASSFEVRFTINDRFYSYGFSALLQERKVLTEWLYELYQNGSGKMLFKRESAQKPVIGDGVKLVVFDRTKLSTYLDDFDENSNKLFLTFMNTDKQYGDNSGLRFFKDVFDWLTKRVDIYTPQTLITSFEYYYNEASLNKVNELIRVFDTGISKVDIVEIPQDELKKELPPLVFNRLIGDVRKKIEGSNGNKLSVSMRSNDRFFNVEASANGDLKITTLKLQHGNSFYDFRFQDESDGTRRVFDLLDILLNSGENRVYIIDEIERSLHPKLTEKFIKLFDEMHRDKKIQLIFTTHESTIMDQDLFRRDEIWFVERDLDNNSSVYSLDRFKERYDKKLSKAYLEGRYGAIPIFATFNTEV